MNVIRVHENIIRTSSEYHLNMTRIISENHPNIIRRRSEHHQDMIWISSKCPLNVIRRPSGYTLRISSEYNPNKIWKSSEYHLNIIRCAKKVGQEGRKVGSLKRRVRSHLLRWEMKNCTPLWHETHFQVKMCKVPGVWNTFGSCDVEICTRLWREAHFEVKKYKTPRAHDFWKLGCGFVWQAQGIVHLLSEVSETWGFCSSFNYVGRRGTYAEDLARCLSRGRHNTIRDTWVRHVRRSGGWFS
jgi:hypothetical protein